MSDTIILWLFGASFSITWILILWLKKSLEKEVRQLWKRADTHGHTIRVKCANDDCRGVEVETTGIALRESMHE
jgi:hypothetical protein